MSFLLSRTAIGTAAVTLFLLCIAFFSPCARYDGAFFIGLALSGALASLLCAVRWYSIRRGWYRDEHHDPYRMPRRWWVLAALATMVVCGFFALVFIIFAANMGCFGSATF